MVAIAQHIEFGIAGNTLEQIWWAYSRTHGWVVLDRSVTANRTTTLPEQMVFTRCADGANYQQGDAAWDYEDATRYIDSLPYDEASEAEEQLMALQEAYAA